MLSALTPGARAKLQRCVRISLVRVCLIGGQRFLLAHFFKGRQRCVQDVDSRRARSSNVGPDWFVKVFLNGGRRFNFARFV